MKAGRVSIWVRPRARLVVVVASYWMALCWPVAMGFGQGVPQGPSRAVRGAGAANGAGPLAFEVISIRRNSGGSGPTRFEATADGFRAVNLPMFAVIQMAYAPSDASPMLRGDRIAGEPPWVLSDRYDVMAKVGAADMAEWQKPERKQAMLRAMLRAMLAERCNLVAHQASREMPVYDLVVAKGGPKFKAAETADLAELREKHPGGVTMTGGGMMAPGSNGLHLFAVSMGQLGDVFLATMAGRPVLDKTGLEGRYDLALPGSSSPPPPPPGMAQPSGRGAPEPPPMEAPPPGDAESIFTALPESLGLRLEPAKDEVETLVIDRAERPTEN